MHNFPAAMMTIESTLSLSLSLPSENEMDIKIRELHGSIQDFSDEVPPLKD